jgi:hypothetical protein
MGIHQLDLHPKKPSNRSTDAGRVVAEIGVDLTNPGAPLALDLRLVAGDLLAQ